MSRANSAERPRSPRARRRREALVRPDAVASVGSGGLAESAASPAIYTVGLSKRFGTTVAVKSLSLTVAPRRGVRLPRAERRGQDDGREAAARSGAPDRRRGARARRAARRSRDAPADRLPPRAVPLPGPAERQRGASPALPAAGLAEARGADADRRSGARTVGLLDRGDDRVGTFSKGMQQRLGLAVALLGDPGLVVLDEPTSALDPVGRHDVREIIRGLARAGGHRVPQHPPARGGRARLRSRRGHRQGHGRSPPARSTSCSAGRARVRVKVGGARRAQPSALGRFGRWHRDDEWLVVEGVEPVRGSRTSWRSWSRSAGVSRPWSRSTRVSEARFLELLGASSERHVDDRRADVSARRCDGELLLAFVAITVVIVGLSAWGFDRLSHNHSLTSGENHLALRRRR